MSYKKLRAVQEEARTLIRDSIVEDAISRFIAQILEVAAQRNADRIEALEKELAGGSFYQEKDIDAMQDRITTLEAENARLKEALTLIERVYYMEGKDHSYRAPKMNAIAYEAQNGNDLARFRRLFPRNAEASHD